MLEADLDFIGDCINDHGSVLPEEVEERAEVLEGAENDAHYARHRAAQLKRELADRARHDRHCEVTRTSGGARDRIPRGSRALEQLLNASGRTQKRDFDNA